MNCNRTRNIALGLIFILANPVFSRAYSSESDPYIQWIERPWEYRYLLMVDDQLYWDAGRRRQLAEFKKPTNRKFNQSVEAYYQPQTLTVKEIPQINQRDALAILRLDIDNDRTIRTPTDQGTMMEARLNGIMGVVLAPKNQSPPSFTIRFGEFFMGAPYAADPTYSPSICSLSDMEPPSSASTLGRYNKTFKVGSTNGYFGCREWAAQLYDKDRPYIDVTSYERTDGKEVPSKKGKASSIEVGYIRPFLGFSRFEDPPKPVIGNHEGQWFCLTDCPGGGGPGKIDNISRWAKENGWPVPKRSKNIRQYMNTKPDIDE